MPDTSVRVSHELTLYVFLGCAKMLQQIWRPAKEQITQLVQQQPDDSSYDEIIRELAFHLMIERGLKDSDEGRTISNKEMEARLNSGYLNAQL